MIVTIDSFEKYRAFIQDISRDPFFCDPHFTYDPDNLYGSLHRKDESAFAVVADGTVQGLLVRPGLPFRKYAPAGRGGQAKRAEPDDGAGLHRRGGGNRGLRCVRI